MLFLQREDHRMVAGDPTSEQGLGASFPPTLAAERVLMAVEFHQSPDRDIEVAQLLRATDFR